MFLISFMSKSTRQTNGETKGIVLTFGEDNLPIKAVATRADGTK